MTGASVNHKIPSAVPTTSATRGPGAKRENRRGQRNPTASVTDPMAKAPVSMALTAAGSARAAPIGPPVAPEAPNNGNACISTMMTPIPDMNPETTTCGV